MSQIVPFDQAQLPAYMQQYAAHANINTAAAMGAGGESVNHISLKGGRFTIVRGGVKTPTNALALNLVFVRVNDGMNKAFYSTAWNPDEEAKPPVCASDDGVTPRADSEQPQCSTCAACPQNAFGSRINPQTGKKAKACMDKKFVAVVDPNNPSGEMLRLMVPADSLSTLGAFLRGLPPQVPYYAVVAEVSFDQNASYPKLVIRPVGYVSEQAMPVIQQRYDTAEAKLFAGIADAQPQRIPVQQLEQQVPAHVQQLTQQQAPVQQQVQHQVQQPAQQGGFGQPAQQQAPVQQAPVQQTSGFGGSAADVFAGATQQAPIQQQAPVQQQAPAQQQVPVQQQAPAQQQVPVQQQAPVQQTAGGIPDVLPSGRIPGQPAPGKKRRTSAEVAEDEALGIGRSTAPQAEPTQQQAPAQEPAQQPAQQVSYGSAADVFGGQPAQQQAPAQQHVQQGGFGAPAQQPAQSFEQPANQPQVMGTAEAGAFDGWDD